MYPKEIEKYVAELYNRRSEATVVKRAHIREGLWQPQLKKCHENVDAYCQLHKDFKPIRGWLFFDYGYFLDHVAFCQHSVVMSPDGQLIDITPSNATQDYPFLRVEESDKDFFKKEENTDDNGNLYYFLNGA